MNVFQWYLKQAQPTGFAATRISALQVTSDEYCLESKQDTLRSMIVFENQVLLCRIPGKSYEADDLGAT